MKVKDDCSILREMTIRRRRRESLSEIDDVCALLALTMMGFFTTVSTRTGEGKEEGDDEGTTRKGDGSKRYTHRERERVCERVRE